MFFVKRETAYEMRISDWSSDVCSSDLAVAVGRLGAAPQEDQPESVHVVADYETRDAEHHRGDDPAIDRIGRANQGDDRRQQDHHSRLDRKSTRLNSSH